MKRIATCLAILLLAGCTATQQAKPSAVTYSGFLNDYSQLAPTNDPNKVLLRYVDASAPWKSYTKVRLEPVTFWAGADSNVPIETQHMLVDYAYSKMKASMEANGFALTDTAGPGVVVVRVAITDATPATPGLRSISVVVPQAVLVGAVVRQGTGNVAFAGSVQTEGDLIDGVTGKRVAAWVDKRTGGTSIANAGGMKWGDSQTIIDTWAKWSGERLAQLKAGTFN